jgi:uncharacterized protein YdhG (YjbR/CyaY superfamily)
MEGKPAGSTNIDEYISKFDPDVQAKLLKMREVIKMAAPDAEEKISYQMPTFYLAGNLVHFAAMKKHIGFYPTPSAIKAFENRLTDYKCSKGAIQFPFDQPIPYELVEEMVKYRVVENLAKQAADRNR